MYAEFAEWLLVLAVISLPLHAYIDYRMYKNRKFRKYVESARRLKTDRDIYVEYLKICGAELFLFMIGATVGGIVVMMRLMGW